MAALRNPCENLRATREKLGMNQTQFWGPLGVTQSAGSRIESTGRPSKPVAILIEIAYGTAANKVIAALQGR
jgi:predicted transcriptional regulator